MKRFAVVFAAVAVLAFGAGMASAEMPCGMMDCGKGMMGAGQDMMGAGMPGMMGSDGSPCLCCDLGDLGLSAEQVKSLEDKRFEVHKKAIRAGADLKILKLELAKMLEGRTFDLDAAMKKGEEISQKEAELRAAHLGLLHDFGAVLSDEQWQTLRAKGKMMMPGDMMPMMGGMMGGMMGRGMAPCMDDGMKPGGGMMGKGPAPCMTDDGMKGQGGMMKGTMMQGGGMMHHGGHDDDHHDGAKEAEEFFKNEK